MEGPSVKDNRPEGKYEYVPELGLAGFDDGPDQLLYHYTRATTALDSVLPNRTLKLNPYAAMRDPLENKELPLMMRYSGPGTGSAARLPLSDARKILGDLRAQMRLLSLTMDIDGFQDQRTRSFARGYARPRMWEQYGDNHQGVCLAFSAACMTGPFYEQLKQFGAPNIGPVRYTEGGFVVSDARLLDGDGLTEQNAIEALTAHLMNHNNAFWFLKLLDWDAEVEFRFVVFCPDAPIDEPLYAPFGPCLKAVMLGERFDEKLVPRARELAEALDVPLTQIDWRSGWPSTILIA